MKKRKSPVHIGNIVDEEYGRKQAETIINILKQDASDDVKKHALDTLGRLAKIDNVTITNSNFDNRTDKSKTVNTEENN